MLTNIVRLLLVFIILKKDKIKRKKGEKTAVFDQIQSPMNELSCIERINEPCHDEKTSNECR